MEYLWNEGFLILHFTIDPQSRFFNILYKVSGHPERINNNRCHWIGVDVSDSIHAVYQKHICIGLLIIINHHSHSVIHKSGCFQILLTDRIAKVLLSGHIDF